MFIDYLGNSTLEELYNGLLLRVGHFPFSKEMIYQKLKEYCEKSHIPLTEAVIPIIIGKQTIKVSNEQVAVVKHIVTGIYHPEFEGANTNLFGTNAVLQKLEGSRNKKVTVLILEE